MKIEKAEPAGEGQDMSNIAARFAVTLKACDWFVDYRGSGIYKNNPGWRRASHKRRIFGCETANLVADSPEHT